MYATFKILELKTNVGASSRNFNKLSSIHSIY